MKKLILENVDDFEKSDLQIIRNIKRLLFYIDGISYVENDILEEVESMLIIADFKFKVEEMY